MNRKAIKIALIFLMVYSLFSISGTLFLVGWGAENNVKSILLFFYKFPFDWAKLIVEKSLLYLPLNILHWTIIVYFLTLLIIRVFNRIK